MERFSLVSVFVGFALSLIEDFRRYFVDMFSLFDLSAISAFFQRRKIASILNFNLCRIFGAKGRVVFKKTQKKYGAYFLLKDDMPIFLGNYDLFLRRDFSMDRFLAQALSQLKNRYITSYSSPKKGRIDCSDNLIFGNVDFAFTNAYHNLELDYFYSENEGIFDFLGNEFSNTFSKICFSPKIKDYVELIPILKEKLDNIGFLDKEVAIFFNPSRKNLYIEIFVGDVEKHKVKDINGEEKEVVLVVKNESIVRDILSIVVESTLKEYEKMKFDYSN